VKTGHEPNEPRRFFSWLIVFFLFDLKTGYFDHEPRKPRKPRIYFGKSEKQNSKIKFQKSKIRFFFLAFLAFLA